MAKEGSGKLILSGANEYTGDTEIKEGELDVQGTLSDDTNVIIDPGAKYIASSTDTIQSISGGGDVKIGKGKRLTVTSQASSTGATNSINNLEGGRLTLSKEGSARSYLEVKGSVNLYSLTVNDD